MTVVCACVCDVAQSCGVQLANARCRFVVAAVGANDLCVCETRGALAACSPQLCYVDVGWEKAGETAKKCG